MNLKELYRAIDEIAPFAISEAFIRKGYHDNSGVILDCGREGNGVLCSLDFSLQAAEYAKKKGYAFLFTHHPAIWDPILRIDSSSPALAYCVKMGISVVSAHLNLDAAEGGIDDLLMHGLGGRQALALCETVEGGGYGRVYDVEETSFSSFVSHAEREFHTKRTVAYGDAPVRRVASFCGAGFSDEGIAFAMAHGADTIVSSDGKHHLVSEAVGQGLNVLLLTHYSSEHYGFSRIAEKIINQFGGEVFTDERLL